MREIGAEANVLGLVRRGREQKPHVLVVRLIDAIARIETKIVGGLDHVDRVTQGIRGHLHIAEPDHHPSSLSTRSPWNITWSRAQASPRLDSSECLQIHSMPHLEM